MILDYSRGKINIIIIIFVIRKTFTPGVISNSQTEDCLSFEFHMNEHLIQCYFQETSTRVQSLVNPFPSLSHQSIYFKKYIHIFVFSSRYIFSLHFFRFLFRFESNSIPKENNMIFKTTGYYLISVLFIPLNHKDIFFLF